MDRPILTFSPEAPDAPDAAALLPPAAGVLLLVKSEVFDDVYAKVVPYGVVTLQKPTSLQMVSQSLRVLCATRERLRQLEAKQVTVQEKIEEIRLVNRAKWLLIENLHLAEPDAHRYVERCV